MARLARSEVFAPDEVAIVHVMNRVVRRCFLLGTDAVTGKNYDHRKVWIEQQLTRLARCFGIDLLGFAILSNHFHLILRSRPDVVSVWDDAEVARRWLLLCPLRKNSEGIAEVPNQMELNTILNDPQRLETVRLRLSDIAWWMRLLCQHIGTRANHEDHEIGKFWQSRFRAVRLLDEAAILACSAYVDLNPIRAAMAETLEQSNFTSMQRRIQSLQQQMANSPCHQDREPTEVQTDSKPAAMEVMPDRFLSPLSLDERSDTPAPVPSLSGCRCSDLGYLPMPVAGYLELLDWTARQIRADRQGSTPPDAPPIFVRLSIEPTAWCELIGDFGRLFCNVAGRPQTVDNTRTRVAQSRYHIRPRVRQLLSAG